jgi:hypothetical protein
MSNDPESHDSHEPSPLGHAGSVSNHGPDGRFLPGHTASMVVGSRSAAFWRAHAAERAAIEQELISDAGFAPEDAPAALRLAVEGIAQATVVLRSAFERIGEAGGPLTMTGRGRRAFVVWLQTFDRLERGLRLVGLQRRSKPVNPLDAIRQAVIDANREDRE